MCTQQAPGTEVFARNRDPAPRAPPSNETPTSPFPLALTHPSIPQILPLPRERFRAGAHRHRTYGKRGVPTSFAGYADATPPPRGGRRRVHKPIPGGVARDARVCGGGARRQ